MITPSTSLKFSMCEKEELGDKAFKTACSIYKRSVPYTGELHRYVWDTPCA